MRVDLWLNQQNLGSWREIVKKGVFSIDMMEKWAVLDIDISGGDR